MLNIKGPAPVEVRPTLFALNGDRVEAPPIIVPGEWFQNVDLEESGAISGTKFEEGSLQLVHKGPDLVIGAQLYIVNESRSLSLDEKLEVTVATTNYNVHHNEIKVNGTASSLVDTEILP